MKIHYVKSMEEVAELALEEEAAQGRLRAGWAQRPQEVVKDYGQGRRGSICGSTATAIWLNSST